MRIEWKRATEQGHGRVGSLRFDQPTLARYEWPIVEVAGASPGPRLCVMAGVHVNEASSIDAAATLTRFIHPARLRGTVSILPVVSVPNLYRYTLAAAPGVGSDLHWSYPGKRSGTFEEELAHALLFEWAKDADVLLDLHGGDLDERMARYVVVQCCGDGVFDRRALELAACFDTELVVALDPSSMNRPGRCCTGLARFKRFGLVAEAGDQGTSDPQAVAWHREGVLNVARYLGMISGRATQVQKQTIFDRYEWIEAPRDGIVERQFSPGQFVQRGTRIGSMRDLYDQEIAVIEAPASGCIMMQKTVQFARQNYWIGSVAVPKAS